MALVTYVGPHRPGVVIPHGLGEIEALHGSPVEVPDDLAASLLDQPSNWKPATPAKKPTPEEVEA